MTDKDRRALRNGVRLAQDLGRQRALSTFIDGEIGPDVAKITDGELDAHVRATAQTAHHPRGTCRMGLSPDDGAVVNPELKAWGVDGLRIVDASVMPDAIGGNINGPVIMIAEVASDIIRGKAIPAAA